jgi:16S rRNA (uracil1498-N3)-methyltransferase
MRFLFISRQQIVEHSSKSLRVNLDSTQSNRLSKVLRLQRGDKTLVRVLPDGELYEAEICSLKGSKGELILKGSPIEPECQSFRNLPPIELLLGMAIIKKKNFELVVQKVSELGGSSITPLEAERSDTRLVSSFSKDNRRLYDITLEACMQSERPIPLKVAEPLTPLSFAAKALGDGSKLLILHEAIGDNALLSSAEVASMLKEPEELEGRPRIAVMIGPEGGFSQSEIDELIKIGGQVRRVPGFILRAETAAIMVASIFLFR